MSAISTHKTVAELVVECPSLTRAFEKLGIDFCCGGKKTLTQACADIGLDADTVVKTLDALDGLNQGSAEEQDWSKASLTALTKHLVEAHHHYLREELPHLAFLTDKVSQVHGERHPSLFEVKVVFDGLSTELSAHLDKEERILFPAINRLDAAANGTAGMMPVASPIRVMEAEHDSAGQALENLRQLTGNYTTPEDGCNSYRAMLEGLLALEKDLHIHIHKENNILFPRAIALQQ